MKSRPNFKDGSNTSIDEDGATGGSCDLTEELEQGAFSCAIITNDPQSLEVKFAVFGEITKSVAPEFSGLELDTISDAAVTERKIRVYTYIDEITELKQLSWTQDDTDQYIELSCKKVELAENRDVRHRHAVGVFEIDFKIKQGYPMGNISSGR